MLTSMRHPVVDRALKDLGSHYNEIACVSDIENGAKEFKDPRVNLLTFSLALEIMSSRTPSSTARTSQYPPC